MVACSIGLDLLVFCDEELRPRFLHEGYLEAVLAAMRRHTSSKKAPPTPSSEQRSIAQCPARMRDPQRHLSTQPLGTMRGVRTVSSGRRGRRARGPSWRSGPRCSSARHVGQVWRGLRCVGMGRRGACPFSRCAAGARLVVLRVLSGRLPLGSFPRAIGASRPRMVKHMFFLAPLTCVRAGRLSAIGPPRASLSVARVSSLRAVGGQMAPGVLGAYFIVHISCGQGLALGATVCLRTIGARIQEA